MTQIRLSLTTEVKNVLHFLKKRYPLLSDAEIIKMALSKVFVAESKETLDLTDPHSKELLKQASVVFNIQTTDEEKENINTSKLRPLKQTDYV